MVTLLALIAHVLVLGGILGMIALVVNIIRAPSSPIEKLARVIALLLAFLVYYGARVVGLSIPALLFESLSLTKPLSLGFLGILLPSLIGALVAHMLLRAFRDRSSPNLPSRLLILVASFFVVMFCDIYAATYTTASAAPEILPNLTFTVGLGLYLILRWEERTPELTESSSSGRVPIWRRRF